MATSKTKPKKAKAPKKLQTADALEKKTIKTRVDCSALVGTKAPQSPVWAAQPAIADSGQKLVAIGTALANADAAAIKADNDALNAHTTRDALVVEWDSAYGVYAANVSRHAATPAEVVELALSVHTRATHMLAPPLGITAKIVGADIDIRVNPAPGLKAVEIEITSTPSDPNSYKRLKGNGAKRIVPNPAPGTYAIRACSVRADDESAFTDPVSVVVK